MPENDKPPVVVATHGVLTGVNLFLHTISISIGLWCGVQLWLINRFLIVYAVGSAKMAVMEYMTNGVMSEDRTQPPPPVNVRRTGK